MNLFEKCLFLLPVRYSMTLNTQHWHVVDIQTSSVSYLSKYVVDPPILTVISLKGVCASLRSYFIADLTEVLPRVALAVVWDEQLSGQGIFKQKSHSEWAAIAKGPAAAFTAECTQSNLFGCYEAQILFLFSSTKAGFTTHTPEATGSSSTTKYWAFASTIR